MLVVVQAFSQRESEADQDIILTRLIGLYREATKRDEGHLRLYASPRVAPRL
jgi:hypothetical protein